MNLSRSTINPTGLSVSQIRTLLAQARFSPSGDNAQPFHFTLLDQAEPRLQIHYSDERGQHQLNRAQHASLITLGFVLESLDLAASLMHQKIEFEFFGTEGTTWAEVSFSELKASEQIALKSELAKQLEHRESNRSVYDPISPQQQEGLASLQRDLALLRPEATATRTDFLVPIADELIALLVKAENLLWTNSDIVRDLSHWMRLNRSEFDRSHDGLYWKNLGMKFHEAQLFKLIRKVPSLMALIWPLGAGFLVRLTTRRWLQSATGLAVFSVTTERAPTAHDYISIGRESLRTWLGLTRLGLAAQPLSYACISYSDVIHAPDWLTPKERAYFSRSRKRFLNLCQMTDRREPLWMIRFGASPRVPQDARTKRRSVDDLLRITKQTTQ